MTTDDRTRRDHGIGWPLDAPVPPVRLRAAGARTRRDRPLPILLRPLAGAFAILAD